MSRLQRVIARLLPPLLLFAIALALRWAFFQGFTLCDDAEELPLIERLAASGPDFQGHLQYRVPMWWFNVVSFQLFGRSELAFFLPTVLMSASLPPVAYFIMRTAAYGRAASFLAGLVVATAPFEVLVGTLRANDLILAWFLALAVLALLPLERRPVRQGAVLAVLLWLAFYAKFWAVFLVPPLGLYYAYQAFRLGRWRAATTFTLVSAVLHFATAAYWKMRIGVFLPFVHSTSATYPVAPADLSSLLRQYPAQLFLGSEFGTTLFGAIPWLVLGLLAAKLACAVIGGRARRAFGFDRLDLVLVASYGSFFLLLEFFPNTFTFDRYYSAPRIFRYLTPISFPMALHLAKMLLDGRPALALPAWTTAAIFAPLLVLNLAQAEQATRPGRTARGALVAVTEDIRAACPPRVLVDNWYPEFLDRLYLRGSCAQGTTLRLGDIYQASEYERWLATHQATLPVGTLLVSGLASCVHYGCRGCGFRLRRFAAPLDPRWALVREYATLDYLPVPEPVALWRLEAQPALTNPPPPPRVPVADPQTRFKVGTALFDAAKYPEAREWFAAILHDTPQGDLAQDARYFYAVSYWREGDREATIREFSALLTAFPRGRWAAGAHYHIGLAYQGMGDLDRAREHFEAVLRDHSDDRVVGGYARDALASLPKPSVLERLRGWLRGLTG